MLRISNNKATMKFVQLHYFLSQTIRGEKDIVSPPVQKMAEICPPLNSVPGIWYLCNALVWLYAGVTYAQIFS